MTIASSERSSGVAQRLARRAAVALVLAFCLGPLWLMALASVESDAGGSGALLPRRPTLDNFRQLLSGTFHFGLGVRNSLAIAGSTTLVALAAGASAGYALGRLRFRGKRIVLAALLTLAMFPGVALLPALFQLFSRLGWIDRMQAIVVPDVSFALPFAGWLLANVFSELPPELEEAARVDGATRWGAFWRVVLPVVSPGVVAAALVVFILTWNEFLFANAMTLSLEARPVTVTISQLPNLGGFGITMAAGVLSTIPLVVLVLAFQRRLAGSLVGARAEPSRRAARRGTARPGTARRLTGPRVERWAPALGAVLLLLLVTRSGPLPRPAARADDGARVTDVEVLAPRLLQLSVWSPALGRVAKARLLLPRPFGAAPGRRWPVLYLLHGCCDNEASWTRSTDIEQLTEFTDLLVVMPDGGQAGFYSDWHNGGRDGPPRWETFHLIELRQLLERGYQASDRRAVAGLSMGGLGAIGYAARHPGMFAAAASYSGILDTGPDGGSAMVIGLADSFGQSWSDLWGDPRSPAWRAHDPYELAPHLRGTRLFVSFGDGAPGPFDGPDALGSQPSAIEADIASQNVRFVEHLRTLGIPATIDAYGPGVHDWPYWQRELHRSFPILLQALGAQR